MSYTWNNTGSGGGGGGGSVTITAVDPPVVPDLTTLAARAPHVPREEVVVTDVGDGSSHLFKKILPAVGLSSWIDLGVVGQVQTSGNPDAALWADNDVLQYPDGDNAMWI